MKNRYKKKKFPWALLIVCLVVVAAVVAIVLASIFSESDEENEPKRDIGIKTTSELLYENGVYKDTVDYETTKYDLASKITFEDDVTAVYSNNSSFSSTFDGKNISLNPGDNKIYLKVTDNDDETNVLKYTFNIYRKKQLTVNFEIDGEVYGTPVSVEEGTTISPPSASKHGHTLKWEYNFETPITADMTITGTWIANDCIIKANVDGQVTEYGVKYGEIIQGLATPEKFGYRFVRWMYEDTLFDPTKPYVYDTEIEIVAQFVPISYTIQYVLDNSTMTNSPMNKLTFTVEDLVVSLFDPTHTSANYIFVGWYNEANPDVMVNAITLADVEALGDATSIVLHAKWKVVSNVTFNANEGECDTGNNTFVVGEEYELPVPSRENFTFIGWYNGTSVVSNKGVWNISTDVELVAKWEIFSNDIEYVANGGVNNSQNPSFFDKETDGIDLFAPTFDDKHIFAGWFTDINFTEGSQVERITKEMLDDDTVLILYAKWIVVSDVTFDANGGSCDEEEMSITYGEDYTLPTPSRDKYIFGGWYFEGSLVNISGKWLYDVDVELVAKWIPKEFNITYELDGGKNNDGNLDKFTVETDPQKLVLVDPEKDYCTFAGWYLDSAFTMPVTSIDPLTCEGAIVYAKWEKIEVTINYNANGGSVSKDSDVIYLGDNYILPTPVLAGYKFVGWYLGDTLVELKGAWNNYDVTVLDLVARWEIVKYTITYDFAGGNNGGLTFKTEYTILDEDYKLPIPKYDSTHFFVGWSLDGGVSSPSVTITKGSTGDRTYSAVWTENKDASTGLLFTLVDGKCVIVGIDRVINNSITAGIKIPATIAGAEVVAIDSYAFKEFGEKFSETDYANMQNSYVTISVPTTVKRIGAYAFENCNGIKVSLYDPNNKYADYEAWDKTVTWEAGNRSARDCVWGFRPAIGWTRYSQVVIPDDYE